MVRVPDAHDLAAGVHARTTLTSSRTASNPGPMTLDGTNSYLLAAPGSPSVIVVDPGPLDEEHLAALAVRPVALVLITHHHLDHTAASERFAAMTGAPVRALDPAFCVGGAPLTDGEVIEAAGVHVQVLATPGHTADSICFLLRDDVSPAGSATGSVLTGDTILGRGTTIIAHPDGGLGDYLATLDRLGALGPATVLPAHGPVLPDLGATVEAYRTHRLERLAQVTDALDRLGGNAEVPAVTDAVYTDIDPAVRPAAERSVAAQLAYLRSR